MLQSMGSQRDSHDWVTEQQQLMENHLSIIQTPLEKQYNVATLFCGCSVCNNLFNVKLGLGLELGLGLGLGLGLMLGLGLGFGLGLGRSLGLVLVFALV